MARGRAASYDTHRESMLERAAELFALHGYPSTSMNQVAEACGLSKPALYHYFRDKEALLVAIAETHVQQLHTLVDEVLALPLEPRAKLCQLILRFVEEYADAQYAHRVLTEDVRFLKPDDRERVLTHERAVVAAFAETVAACKPQLRGAQLDKPLAMLLFGMINWMFTWLKPDGALDHDTIAPVVVDLFLGGLDAVAAKHGAAGVPVPPAASARVRSPRTRAAAR